MIAMIGSIVAIAVSILSAWSTFLKANNDRKDGISNREMNTARFVLDSLKASLDVKDTLLEQLKDENAALRERIKQLEDK